MNSNSDKDLIFHWIMLSLISIILLTHSPQLLAEEKGMLQKPSDIARQKASLMQLKEASEKRVEEEIESLEEQPEMMLEAEGMYPLMERNSSLSLATLQKAWDRPQKAAGQIAPGIIRYSWSPSFVMPVRLRDYMTTTIHFPNWERISAFYVGDPHIFSLQQAQPNVIVLRSHNAGADTNLTVIGSGSNVYNFYLRSEGWNSQHISDFTVFIDAPLPTETPSPSSTSSSFYLAKENLPLSNDYLRHIGFKPENMQFDFQIRVRSEKDAEIAPERVWHDGVFTYFDYGQKADSMPRPVIHLVVDGVDTMVNTRSTGADNHLLVAEAVGDFTLRNGQKVVCIKRLKSKEFSSKQPLIISGSPTASENHSLPAKAQKIFEYPEDKRR